MPIFTIMSRRVAPSTRNTSRSSGSMVANPVATLTTTGKNDSRNAVMIAGIVPTPNQMTSTGTSAALGTLLKAIRQRIKRTVHKAERADEDAQHQPEKHCNRETREGGTERGQPVHHERITKIVERGERLDGRRQDEIFDVKYFDDQPPQHQKDQARDPWCQTVRLLLCSRRLSQADVVTAFVHEVDEVGLEGHVQGSRSRQWNGARSDDAAGTRAHDVDRVAEKDRFPQLMRH